MKNAALKRSAAPVATADQSARLFDGYVRASLNISGDEFIKRYNSGKYAKECCNSKVLKAIMLIPASAPKSRKSTGRRGKKQSA